MRLLLLLIAITPVFANEVKNGGDPIFIALSQARDEAAARLEKIRISAIEKNVELVTPLMKKNRKLMSEDLRKSKLKLLPDGKKNENGKCAQTNDQKGGDITIDLEACKKSEMFRDLTGPFSKEASISLFYNEVSHHFGLDDDDAARFSVSITDAYSRGIYPRTLMYYEGKYIADPKLKIDTRIKIYSEVSPQSLSVLDISESIAKIISYVCNSDLENTNFRSISRLTTVLRGESKGTVINEKHSPFAYFHLVTGDDGEDITLNLKFSEPTVDLVCTNPKVKELKLELNRVEKFTEPKVYTHTAFQWIYEGVVNPLRKPKAKDAKVYEYIYNGIIK